MHGLRTAWMAHGAPFVPLWMALWQRCFGHSLSLLHPQTLVQGPSGLWLHSLRTLFSQVRSQSIFSRIPLSVHHVRTCQLQHPAQPASPYPCQRMCRLYQHNRLMWFCLTRTHSHKRCCSGTTLPDPAPILPIPPPTSTTALPAIALALLSSPLSTAHTSAGFAHPIAAACDDGSVRLFAVEAGEPGAHYERSLARLQGRVLAVAWHPSGTALVAGGVDGCIHALDLGTGERQCRACDVMPAGLAPGGCWAPSFDVAAG